MAGSACRPTTCKLGLDPVEAQPNGPFDSKANDHQSRDKSGCNRTNGVPFLSLVVVVIKCHDSSPKHAGLYLMASPFAARNLVVDSFIVNLNSRKLNISLATSVGPRPGQCEPKGEPGAAV
jgi:hypothetical protein